MNLAILEKMTREGDMSTEAVRYLIGCRAESEWLDYKSNLELSIDKSAADFSRDVLAMKNTGGGYLLVGVQDKTWVPTGIAANLPYDTKLLRDQVRRCTGLDLDVDIVHHNIQIDGSESCFCPNTRPVQQKKK